MNEHFETPRKNKRQSNVMRSPVFVRNKLVSPVGKKTPLSKRAKSDVFLSPSSPAHKKDFIYHKLCEKLRNLYDLEEIATLFVKLEESIEYNSSLTKIINLYHIMEFQSNDIYLFILIIVSKIVNLGNKANSDQIKEANAIVEEIKASDEGFSLFNETTENPHEILMKTFEIINGSKNDLEFTIKSVVPDYNSYSIESYSPSSPADSKREKRRKSQSPRTLRILLGDSDDENVAPKVKESPKKKFIPKKLSKDDIIELIRKKKFDELKKIGRVEHFMLKAEEKKLYSEINKRYFSIWDTAYQGVYYIWDKFNSDNNFYLPIMLHVIPKEFFEFSAIGLHSLSLEH